MVQKISKYACGEIFNCSTTCKTVFLLVSTEPTDVKDAYASVGSSKQDISLFAVLLDKLRKHESNCTLKPCTN